MFRFRFVPFFHATIPYIFQNSTSTEVPQGNNIAWGTLLWKYMYKVSRSFLAVTTLNETIPHATSGNYSQDNPQGR